MSSALRGRRRLFVSLSIGALLVAAVLLSAGGSATARGSRSGQARHSRAKQVGV